MLNRSDLYRRFTEIGEFFAAGYMENRDAAPFIRFARAWRRYLEGCRMQPYNGESLYPCGKLDLDYIVQPNYSETIVVFWSKLKQLDLPLAKTLWDELVGYRSQVEKPHAVGGNMYTHSFPNFRRLIREGLDAYRRRVEKMEDPVLRQGLLDLLEGIRCFHSRSLQVLTENNADPALIAALEKVPFQPANTLYEALVSWNFIYYLDGCDDIGQLDTDLIDFYRGEDMTPVFRQFFLNVDANDGWSGSLGPDYNPLTLQVLHACKGIRRPSIELRVTPQMPQEVWDAALESIRAGGGSPSLYNEAGYQQLLARVFPDAPAEDRLRFCGGGCTETMLVGLSNVGSIDAGVNLLLVFEEVMRRELPTAGSFEEFYSAMMAEFRKVTKDVLDRVSRSQQMRAKNRPQPMRTLLIDDCIDKGKDYNNGGARYTGSVINLAGMINVLDSLLVIRQLIFLDRIMDGQTMLDRLDAGETFLHYKSIPRHGTDHPEANAMAARLSRDLCAIIDSKTPYSGGKFLPGSIQFNTYGYSGAPIGPTPDGRKKGAPLCDSIGAIHGNDRFGATALLSSAAALYQQGFSATPVMNLRLDAAQTAKGLQALANSYFHLGGLQLQVTCVSKEDLLAAQKHPEQYSNLIVRIGGFSEYFTHLSDELQQTVIDRTVYGM